MASQAQNQNGNTGQQQTAQSTTAASASSGGALPQDAQAVIAMLRELGVSEFEPRVISQLLDFAYGYVRDVLSEARSLATHAGHKQVDNDDIKLAVQFWSDKSFTSSLPAPGVVAEMAHARNSQPLPAPRPSGKPVAGIRLPPDRHCLTQAAFQLRSQEIPQQQQPQARFIASSQPASVPFGEQRHPSVMNDHRTYASGVNQLSRPSSSISATQPGSAMLTDYDNPL